MVRSVKMWLLLMAACLDRSVLRDRCVQDDDCSQGRSCVLGHCAAAGTALPSPNDIVISADANEHQVRLSWSAILTATGYVILRRDAGASELQQIASTNETTFVDTPAWNDCRPIEYRVLTRNGASLLGEASAEFLVVPAHPLACFSVLAAEAHFDEARADGDDVIVLGERSGVRVSMRVRGDAVTDEPAALSPLSASRGDRSVRIDAGNSVCLSLDTCHSLGTDRLRAVLATTDAFFVAGDAGALYRSFDGNSWTRLGVEGAPAFVALALVDDAVFALQAPNLLWRVGSANAALDTTLPEGSYHGLAYAHGVTVAVGDYGAVARRVAGGSFERIDLQPMSMQTVAHAGAAFIAAGEAGTIMDSEDGLVWRRLRGSVSYQAACLVDGRPIALGRGSFLSGPHELSRIVARGSTLVGLGDAALWTQMHAVPMRVTSDVTWRALAANGQTVLALGSAGEIARTLDGTTFINAQTTGPIGVVDLTFHSQRFWAITSQGEISSSADGEAWTAPTRIIAGEQPSRLVQHGDRLVMGTLQGSLLMSFDGLSWERLELEASGAIQEIASTPLGLLAVTTTGVAFASAKLPKLDRIALTEGAATRAVRATLVTDTAVMAYGLDGLVLQHPSKDGP